MPDHIRWLIANLIAGIKSNIPLCCVLYYCFWIFLFKRYSQPSGRGGSVGYYRCHVCRLRGVIKELIYDGQGEEYYYHQYFTNRRHD